MKNEKSLIGVGLITALGASLCCITPLLSLLAGASGLVSIFSWLEPFRYYFIGLTIIVLSFAWFIKLKKQNNADCGCDDRPRFTQTKTFLGVITILVLLLLSFPYYANLFYKNVGKKELTNVDKSKLKSIEFKINGMTCDACTSHIKNKINELNGIYESSVSYENGNAFVLFDKEQTTIKELERMINSTGYNVTKKKEK